MRRRVTISHLRKTEEIFGGWTWGAAWGAF